MKKIVISIIKIPFLICIFLCTSVFTVNASLQGDFNLDGKVGLEDAIYSLQVIAGAGIREDTEVGLEDTIYILKIVSGKEEPLSFGDLGKPNSYEKSVIQFRSLMGQDAFIGNLPSSFDWRNQGIVTAAKRQGGCGSCWAFAAVGALESKILKNNWPSYDLSEQQQISCNSNMGGCSGGTMLAIKFWNSEGPMEESCTGYCECNKLCDNLPACNKLDYHTTNYYTVNADDVNEVKTSLHNDGPAYFRYNVYTDFRKFWQYGENGDVYIQSTGSYNNEGHAVLIIGWDDSKSAWLCKNSWGESEGPNGDGTFWIAYSGHNNNLSFGMANFSIVGTSPDVSNIKPVYRFWSASYTSHFYTIWEIEKNRIINSLPEWRYEYIAWYAYSIQESGTLPVYRFWSDKLKAHFYTISEEEKNTVMNNPDWDYKYEGIAWYAYSSAQQPGTVPVHRFWSEVKAAHFYTASENEKNLTMNNPEWEYEHIAFYVPEKK